MNAVDFVSKVRKMRAAQKAYFKNRLRDDLIKSKQLESEVDFALKEGVTLREFSEPVVNGSNNAQNWGWNGDAPDLDA